MVELAFWNAFQIPMAVPIFMSFPTKTGKAHRNVIAFVDKAKEDSKIGARGWTVVNPIKANTTMYRAPVHDTVVQ